MSGGVNPAGGVLIAIGSTVVCTDLAEYQADSYVNIGFVEDGGQFGDESKPIEFTALSDARVEKFKGPRDAGTMSLVCGDDPTDPGQGIVEAAQLQKFNYNFRVTLNDAVTLSGDPSTHYFAAKVMGERRNVGNVMNIVKRTFNLAINSAIFETLPT